MNDPIAAIATSTATDAALAVIRMSGERCHALLSACLRKKGAPVDLARWPVRRVKLCEFVDPTVGQLLDLVTVILYRAPGSYTGEDSAELICHGGRGLTRQIYRALLRAGFSPALGGDFTRRAFLNGKMDLTQAESVSAATQAGYALAARAAASGLSGETSARIQSMANRLVDILSLLEANLDLTEEGINVVDPSRILSTLNECRDSLAELLRHAERSALLSGALRVALIGKPNVGKSTLLNRLLGSDRAIVSPDPGTTRDVVEGRAEIGEMLFEFVDTAGIRQASGEIESEGIQRSRHAASGAHLVLFVLDASSIGAEDHAIAADLPPAVPRLTVLNKTDIATDARIPGNGFSGAPVVRTVGTAPEGVRDLFVALEEQGRNLLGGLSDAPVWISERQSECLRRAQASVDRALSAMEEGGLTEEFVSADIREALAALADFAGRKTPDDVLNRIFSKFCVGK
ncbi:MAG: tRNA uridine-5-carboxymethylaminomethyl(34) synthesis GTPase MnmE [Candidatus Lindowbacteria bacterium RIFCSPLOWO2_12_FULL_62_27]|nr:MAG: tRNA uridine-5-carboxymethylaminomethyl(34) synthesis GTPase MnmE [Candidatus Lindowbacteria bacterium RIFCSPLOWO2_12_FULL_62_27]OGH61612.1 MAG: tRNA uridine-5-carboxymethylaminomethyl(34) synthesis GTPase MnmE [Candidatus Lindowbacteria bacterium RIFCSPLOWO2_02_FULL_62_12]